MKITFECDTDKENFDPCELEQLKHASDMARALHQLEEAVREWYKYPSDNAPLNADTLHEKFYEIIQNNNIDIEKLWG